jgi:ABC-type multidrug transport system ATPase subunit
MDTSARRKTWEMLKNNKRGRIIILTTHHMEEADILADRIAIMSEGRLKCLGSPLFLKNRYGSGYMLHISLDQGSDTDRVISFVTSGLSGVSVQEEVPGELDFRIPANQVTEFPQFFDTLDHQ